MSGSSSIVLPCGHMAAYRDLDPEEGVLLNKCDECGWRRGLARSSRWGVEPTPESVRSDSER